MKTLTIAKYIFATILGFSCLSAQAKDVPQTDLGKVFNQGVRNPINSQRFNVEPGLYIIGDDNNKVSGTHFLIIDKSVNDDQKIFALMISQDEYRGRNFENKGTGRFYVGKPIKNGTAVMLSPVFIDLNGNLAIESEVNQKAPVIEITLRNQSGEFRYPYMLQGHNGALNGYLLGMRAAVRNNPNLKPWPENNVFSGNSNQDNLVVSGSTVAIHNGRSMEQRFELLPINGEFGKFAEMVSTELDTMGEVMISESSVRKLAFFMTNAHEQEIFIVATPTARVGEFKFEFYGPKCRTFTDYFFPGRLTPQ